jgi:hypothetical protein
MAQTGLDVVLKTYNLYLGRPQWPRGLRRGSTAARLLGLRVRIPPGEWMFVCCECCMFLSLVQRSPSGCDVSDCDLETSKVRRPRSTRAVEP